MHSLTDIFKFNPSFLENEAKYEEIKNEILGSDEKGDHSGGSAEGLEWGKFSNDQITGGRTHHALEQGLGEPSTCHFLNNHEFPHV